MHQPGLRSLVLAVSLAAGCLSVQDGRGAEATANLVANFRGTLSGLEFLPPAATPQADTVNLPEMARAALNYLRGNPDPQRNYECKWSLGPLGIPCLVPLLPSNTRAFDPISLADTDCRMDWQYAYMREMAGEAEACEVERGVRRRIVSYLKPDGFVWIDPAAWTGPEEAVNEDWASTWASARLLISLAETYRRTKDPAVAAQARSILAALKRIAHWDGPRAFYPGGGTPWKAGQWLTRGWAKTHAHNYPFIVEPALRYYECTGDLEGLELAKAFAEGFLAGSQPDMGTQRIDPQTGAFQQHVHLHSQAFWGVAHLAAVTNEPRYRDWAQRAYDFVVRQGTDYGWYPEFIPQGEYRTEICVVGDMTSAAAWLARGGLPNYWDHVERTVRNEIRRSQFALTPAFVKLFRGLHQDQPAQVVDAALAELRKLEGGFVAQATFNDWVGFPGSLGKPGLYANGIQMMGCCPPEGMRALWEAWHGVVVEQSDGVFINLCFSRSHPAADVRASSPSAGRLDVAVRKSGKFHLRPPSWADRNQVRLTVNGQATAGTWGGPANAYVLVADAAPGQTLSLTWPVPRFTQTFAALSVPGRNTRVAVRWVGNEVVEVEPRGQYLPMFGAK